MPHLLNISRTVLLVYLFFWTASLSGQSFRAFVKAGDRAMGEGDFYTAMLHYAEALRRQEDAAAVQYKYAETARHFFSLDTAALYYQKALEGAPQQYPLALYYLGMVHQQRGQHEQAVDYFEKYLLSRFRNKEYAARARRQIEACRWAQAQVPDTLVTVRQLSRRVNTPYSEFGPFLLGDTLYYSSYRFDNPDDDHQPPRKISKVLYVRGDGRGRPLRRDFNAPDELTAHTAVSPSGNRIYFTRCTYTDATRIRCALYYRELDSRGRWERKANRLPGFINLPDYTATHPSVAFDSVLQSEVLYFTSDRPGGSGGLDIWWTPLDPDHQTFGEPQPLEHVNTADDELTPFFHQAAQTLYFSSDGYPGFGAYDVFRLSRGEEWGPVENLGLPVNSSYNDVYYFLGPDGRQGYLSSNRPGSFYLDEANAACCNDLFSVRIRPPQIPGDPSVQEEPPPVTVTPEPPPVETPPDELEDFLPLALYFDNDEPDRRTRRTTTRKSYGETYRQYYQRKEEYLREYAGPLPEGEREAAEERLDVFFEEEVRKGYEYLRLFSDILLERLRAGEEVEVFIRGYTSPRAQSDYNLALGERRISSLRNHFDEYGNGAFRSFLESGQLTITQRSFGETKAAEGVSDELTDERASIYSPGAARERRVEIEEVERN